MAKLVYVLLDGVSDLPDPTLNWVTPLEAARTPVLDSLARQGAMGLVSPVGKGIAPESDVAVLSMLGYDLSRGYVGRGVVEAVGTGMTFRDGFLALRGNFATVDEDLVISDRRAGRDLSDHEAGELAAAISHSLQFADRRASFELKHTIAHRAVVVIRCDGVHLSDDISNTDPAYSRIRGLGVAKAAAGRIKLQRCRPFVNSKAARLSARLINEFSTKTIRILADHPVNRKRIAEGKMPGNCILLRDAGNRLPRLTHLATKYGRQFACIADMPVEVGIARLTGMQETKAGGQADFEAKAAATVRLLDRFDVVYVHLKGPDEPGHDGDPATKKKVIEAIDSKFFAKLISGISPSEVAVAVSADHSTPCQLRSHSDDPVPLLVYGARVKGGESCRFTERDGLRGSLGFLKGPEVLPRIFSSIQSQL